MLHLLAIVLPPVAVLLTGKPVQALLNIVLTACLWVPGVIHAMVVVGSHQAHQRTKRITASNDGSPSPSSARRASNCAPRSDAWKAARRARMPQEAR